MHALEQYCLCLIMLFACGMPYSGATTQRAEITKYFYVKVGCTAPLYVALIDLYYFTGPIQGP